MATRVCDSNNADSGVDLPPIPINEVPIGNNRGGTVVDSDFIEAGIEINERPLRGGSHSPTEVIDYSTFGVVKDAPAVKTPPPADEQDTRTKVFLGSSAKKSADSSVATPTDAPGIEPCVGWVVVVSGPMRGHSFELQAGQNHIGRDSSNTIVLAKDPGISRKSHVIITYYHRHNMFNVCRGTEGRGTADLNNQPLEMPTQLNSGDEILLTDETTLRFIPLCCENFKW